MAEDSERGEPFAPFKGNPKFKGKPIPSSFSPWTATPAQWRRFLGPPKKGRAKKVRARMRPDRGQMVRAIIRGQRPTQNLPVFGQGNVQRPQTIKGIKVATSGTKFRRF